MRPKYGKRKGKRKEHERKILKREVGLEKKLRKLRKLELERRKIDSASTERRITQIDKEIKTLEKTFNRHWNIVETLKDFPNLKIKITPAHQAELRKAVGISGELENKIEELKNKRNELIDRKIKLKDKIVELR